MEAENKNVVLEIKDLSITIKLDEGTLTPVRGLSLAIGKGETLGLVGESGAAKALPILQTAKHWGKSCFGRTERVWIF